MGTRAAGSSRFARAWGCLRGTGGEAMHFVASADCLAPAAAKPPHDEALFASRAQTAGAKPHRKQSAVRTRTTPTPTHAHMRTHKAHAYACMHQRTRTHPHTRPTPRLLHHTALFSPAYAPPPCPGCHVLQECHPRPGSALPHQVFQGLFSCSCACACVHVLACVRACALDTHTTTLSHMVARCTHISLTPHHLHCSCSTA